MTSDKNHVNMYDDLIVRYASPTPPEEEERNEEPPDETLANSSSRICQACRKKLDSPSNLTPRIWFPKYFCGYCHRKLQHKHSLWIHLFHHTAAMQRPPYTCPLCQKVFDTLSGYKLHLGSLHNVKPSNDCPFCPKKFMDRKLFDAHLLSHQGDDVSSGVKGQSTQHLLEFHRSMVCNDCFLRLQHMCSACREMFNRKEELRQHQMDVHFHCPVCNSCFVKKTNVLQHVKKCHEDLVSTSCDVCRGVLEEIQIKGDDDGNADMYELPEKPAEKGKVYKCVTCNAYFWDDEGEMESTVSSCRVCVQQRKPKRQKTDVRERKFECGECSLKMTSLDEVTTHVRTHAKDPPPKEPEDIIRPQCNICLRLFLTDDALIRHVRLCHHHCVFCTMAFHEKSHLILHVMANHGEENPVVCQECKKLYVTVYQTDPNEPLRQAEGIQFIFRPVMTDEVNVDMEENNPNN